MSAIQITNVNTVKKPSNTKNVQQVLNPLGPNINMHILLAVLHSHPYCLRVLILFKYQVISSLVIISLIIMIFMFD